MTDLAKTLADLAAKATPGPLQLENDHFDDHATLIVLPGKNGAIGTDIARFEQNWKEATYQERRISWKEAESNAALIVTLRNAIPAIIAALTAQAEHDKVLAERDALQAENARLREAQILGVGAMMHAAGRLEIIATCPEDQRIVAALLAACRAARAALEAKP